jgi:ribonuclease III
VNQIRSRFQLFRLTILSRDAQLKELIRHLREKGFDFARFQTTLGYHPRDWRHMLQALVHRSYLQFLSFQWESNERLEFLGDSILNFVVAEKLYLLYPNKEEGYLTKVRSRLVNRKILALHARDLQLADYLLLSHSAAQSIGNGSESILADAFEAVIGALYLDGGLEVAGQFVRDKLLNDLDSVMFDDNYKSTLLEYAQAHGLDIPRYGVVKEEGPEHDRRFTCEVCLGRQTYGSGTGRSKKEAEQLAAAEALKSIEGAHIPEKI